MESLHLIKLTTPHKSRVAHVIQIENVCLYLLVHPSDELLLCSNDAGHFPASRWDAACIHYIKTENAYFMCKYRASEPKFRINSNDEVVCRSVAEACGIPFHGKDDVSIFNAVNSETARGFLRWSMKHKRLALPFKLMLDSIVAAGIEPLNETEYTGR